MLFRSAGTMDHATKESGMRTKSEALEPILGLTAASTKVNGLTTTWKEWGFTPGKTAVAMRASIETTRSMATASTHGLISGSIKACGIAGSSTVSAFILSPPKSRNVGYGKTESESNGSIKKQPRLSSLDS